MVGGWLWVGPAGAVAEDADLRSRSPSSLNATNQQQQKFANNARTRHKGNGNHNFGAFVSYLMAVLEGAGTADGALGACGVANRFHMYTCESVGTHQTATREQFNYLCVLALIIAHEIGRARVIPSLPDTTKASSGPANAHRTTYRFC